MKQLTSEIKEDMYELRLRLYELIEKLKKYEKKVIEDEIK